MGGAVSSSTTDIERLAAKYSVVPKYTDPFHVFLDVSIDHQPAGKLVARLRADVAPLACENFRRLCTGEGGTQGYAGTAFHLHVVSSAPCAHTVASGALPPPVGWRSRTCTGPETGPRPAPRRVVVVLLGPRC